MKRIIPACKKLMNDPVRIKYYIHQYASIVRLFASYVLIMPFRKKLYAQNIWLVTEKSSEARDNGYHFYRYIKNNHPEINIYYAITSDSPDKNKFAPGDKLISFNSWRHFRYSLSAKVSISSQPFGALPQPVSKLFPYAKKLRRKDQAVIHLKHGITKDELPHDLDYRNTHFDLLCCVSEKEKRFMQEMHGYPDENIKTLGFCRYDKLLSDHAVKKQILIMPTHRMWLNTVDPTHEAPPKEKKAFEETEFYRVYSSLLSNTDLLASIRNRQFSIVFYPHYALQPYVNCFMKYSNDDVVIADRKQYDVQQLLLESSILVTDYSSVFFDFAYMKKPEVFYHFDEQQYRAEHFKKGYFDYRNDGFGPVYTEENDVVNEIKHLLENGCEMSEMYRQRTDDFFAFRDANNCKRVFDEVYRKAMEK